MKKSSVRIRKFAVLSAVFIFSLFMILPAFAEESIISSVVISKSKSNPNAYELNIDSTEPVQYKTSVESDNSIYFDLKNSVLSEDVGTIYDDVTNIDSVVVKQTDKNKVRIYVEGKNAKNTEIVFVNSLFDTSQPKKIVINRPISEYQPTSSEDLEAQEDIQDWSDNSFNFSHFARSVLTNLRDGSGGVILIFLSIIAVFAIVIRNLTSKISQDREPLIGLNASRISEGEDLTAVSNRNKSLRAVQDELNRAHLKYQAYLQNKYQNGTKTINVDSVKKGIALNQYQKSSQNPYSNQEVIRLKKEYTTKAQSDSDFRIPPRPKRQVQKEFTSPYIQRKENRVDYATDKSLKPASMKFLESVTKIYEQSGRQDLADGLKNSIIKAKQSI